MWLHTAAVQTRNPLYCKVRPACRVPRPTWSYVGHIDSVNLQCIALCGHCHVCQFGHTSHEGNLYSQAKAMKRCGVWLSLLCEHCSIIVVHKPACAKISYGTGYIRSLAQSRLCTSRHNYKHAVYHATVHLQLARACKRLQITRSVSSYKHMQKEYVPVAWVFFPAPHLNSKARGCPLSCSATVTLLIV